MEDHFHVPENYIGERVHLWLDHMVGVKNPETGAQVPMFICVGNVTFKGQTTSAILFTTHEESIFGPPGEQCLPKRKLANVSRVGSTVELAKKMPTLR